MLNRYGEFELLNAVQVAGGDTTRQLPADWAGPILQYHHLPKASFVLKRSDNSNETLKQKQIEHVAEEHSHGPSRRTIT